MQSPARSILQLVESFLGRDNLSEVQSLETTLQFLQRAVQLRTMILEHPQSSDTTAQRMEEVWSAIQDARNHLENPMTPAQQAFNTLREILNECKTEQEAEDLHRVLNTLTMTATCRESVLDTDPESLDHPIVRKIYDRWLEKARKLAFPNEA